MTTTHKSFMHTSLTAAILTIEGLISQGYVSFKLFKQDGAWNTQVNGEWK